jgi:type VII secretion-associated protein (TIGR03931 family)
VTPVVVEAGPATVRGPGSAPQQWISTALESIDDPIALLDEQPVDVPALWRDVLGAVAGAGTDPLVLVVPTWWSRDRVTVVSDAARAAATDVVVLQRSAILADTTDATVVELSAEYAVVTAPGTQSLTFPRGAAAFTAHLETATAMLLDVPSGVPPLPGAAGARLRRLGIPVTHSTDDRLLRAAAATVRRRGARNRRVSAVLAGTAVTLAAACGGWAAQATKTQPPIDTASRLLVDGAIAVRVPASWTVEHITSGHGSPRVRVSAQGGAPALHITQSAGPGATTIAEVAESLRRAIDSEQDGVFVDFDPAGERGGRPAVTYVERRASAETRWAVVADGAVRIAIGCQGAPGDPAAVEDACLQAVRSAHALR